MNLLHHIVIDNRKCKTAKGVIKYLKINYFKMFRYFGTNDQNF